MHYRRLSVKSSLIKFLDAHRERIQAQQGDGAEHLHADMNVYKDADECMPHTWVYVLSCGCTYMWTHAWAYE